MLRRTKLIKVISSVVHLKTLLVEKITKQTMFKVKTTTIIIKLLINKNARSMYNATNKENSNHTYSYVNLHYIVVGNSTVTYNYVQ